MSKTTDPNQGTDHPLHQAGLINFPSSLGSPRLLGGSERCKNMNFYELSTKNHYSKVGYQDTSRHQFNLMTRVFATALLWDQRTDSEMTLVIGLSSQDNLSLSLDVFVVYTVGSAARDLHGIKQITVGPPSGIKQITMFIRDNVDQSEEIDKSATTNLNVEFPNGNTYSSRLDRESSLLQRKFSDAALSGREMELNSTFTSLNLVQT
ncbi:hypothetical protein J6590_071959 [Homalodisca vitripennis]|nr:hypothetical protein J6590_071959 [Homalodisca vitripennis]